MHRIHGLSSLLAKDEKGKEPHRIFLCSHFEVVIVIIRKRLHKSSASAYKFCCQIFISYECLRNYFPKQLFYGLGKALQQPQIHQCILLQNYSYFTKRMPGNATHLSVHQDKLHLHHKALSRERLANLSLTQARHHVLMSSTCAKGLWFFF